MTRMLLAAIVLVVSNGGVRAVEAPLLTTAGVVVKANAIFG